MHIQSRRDHLSFIIAMVIIVFSRASNANPINDQVEALSDEKRQGIFARMMQREGERCPSVSRTFFQGQSSDGAAFWTISCDGGKDWQIMIKNSPQGDMKILECAALKLVGGGRCFTKLKK